MNVLTRSLAVLTIALLPAARAQAAALFCDLGWCLENPQTPDLVDIGANAVWGASAADVFAVGSLGKILRYDGAGWSAMPSGTQANLLGVWGTSGSDVFAVGEGGTVLRYDGSAWSAMDSGTAETLADVWGSSGADIYAVGSGGAVRHFDGTAWTGLDLGLSAGLSAVWGASSADVYVAGGAGTMQHYDGSSWRAVDAATTADLLGVRGCSPSDVYAVGAGGTVRRYDGSGWSALDAGTTADLHDVWCASPGSVFVAANDGLPMGSLLRYSGGPAGAWSTTLSGVGFLAAIWGASGSELFAVGWERILHSDGAAWTPMQSAGGAPLADVWAAGAGGAFAVGQDGRGEIFHRAGGAWTAEASVGSAWLHGIWGTSASDVFAVGSDIAGRDIIAHRDGAGWTVMEEGLTSWLNDVGGSSGSDVYAVGDGGVILHYSGSVWSDTALGFPYSFSGVWVAPGGEVFVVGPGGAIVQDAGAGWTDRSAGELGDLVAAWGASATDVFAVGNGGVIAHFDGTAWAPMSSGTTANLGGVWGSSGDDVYAVGGDFETLGRPAGVIVHYDGTSWTPVLIPWVHDLQGVSGTSALDVVATGLNGVVLRYAGPAPGSLQATAQASGSIALSWPGVGGEASYQVYRAAHGTAEFVFLADTAAGATQHVDPLGCSSAADYRVLAVYPDGARSAFSPSAAGQTPPCGLTLLAPAGVVATATPTYEWEAVADAESYLLWVGTGSSTVLAARYTAAEAGCPSGTGNCAVTPGTALGMGSWYFNVRPTSAAGSGSWASPQAFSYALTPTALALLAPSGVVDTASPTYTWSAQPGVEAYLLWVGTGSATALSRWYSAAEAGCGAGTGECSATPDAPLAPGRWYFNVRGRNAAGTGPWAGARSFAFATTPAAPALFAPSGPQASGSPEYSWQAEPGIDAYLLWIGTPTSTVVATWYPAAAAGCAAGTGSCAVTPAVALPGGTWYFNVRARNASGTGPWGGAKRFSTP